MEAECRSCFTTERGQRGAAEVPGGAGSHLALSFLIQELSIRYYGSPLRSPMLCMNHSSLYHHSYI